MCSRGRLGGSHQADAPMTKLLIAMVVTSFAPLGAAMAQGTSCESRAVDKNGKALVGAAKTSFLTKCRREACEPKAVDKNGKAPIGAAEKSFLAKCEREAQAARSAYRLRAASVRGLTILMRARRGLHSRLLPYQRRRLLA